MQQRFCQYITENSLFSPSNKIILAVSGGIDSVVMTDLFHKSHFQFAIAHCNFKLRGQESDGDESFARTLAESYNVPFYTIAFDTLQEAESKKISIQMAARELRYQWFYRLLESEGYDYFATAHHRNDVLETLLLNITKGTTIHGLSGIRLKAGKAIRPLLFADREKIVEFARQNSLSWREDSSNESTKYQRNLIRHEVIPILKKINPSLESTFEETIDKIRASENIFNQKIQELKNNLCEVIGNDLFIDLETLNEQQEKILILYELLKDYGFNYSEIKNLILTDQPGKKIESATHSASRDRKKIIVQPIRSSSEIDEFVIPEGSDLFKTSWLSLSLRISDIIDFQINGSPEVACLDYHKLKFPLKLRKWKEGDWFMPIGLGKRKKVSDLLVDLKIPRTFKDKVMVIQSGETIAWVVGLRLDDRFKISTSTRKILKIERLLP